MGDFIVQAVIFDFNGVIIDDEKVHLELFQEVLSERGVPLDENLYWKEFLGMDDRGCFQGAWSLVRGELPSDRLLEELIREKSDRYRLRLEKGLPLYEGASSLIRALSANLPLGIVSGALRGEIERTLEIADLSNCFQFVVSAEDTERGKPDPEGYRLGFLRLLASGFLGKETDVLVIEDSVQGVEAAKGAGMKAFAVSHSYPSSALAHADRVFENIAGIHLSDILPVSSEAE
ncbi:MAG: HAD family hydrolase [Leptospirales bacterium]